MPHVLYNLLQLSITCGPINSIFDQVPWKITIICWHEEVNLFVCPHP